MIREHIASLSNGTAPLMSMPYRGDECVTVAEPIAIFETTAGRMSDDWVQARFVSTEERIERMWDSFDRAFAPAPWWSISAT